MRRVFYPTLDLFSYSLAYGLGDDEAQARSRRAALIAFLGGCGLDAAALAEVRRRDRAVSSKPTDVLKERDLLDVGFRFSEGMCFKGYVLPKRLNDCYALLLDCSIEDADTQVYTLDNLLWLQRLQEVLIPKQEAWAKDQAVLGETWMLSLLVDELLSEADYAAIARSCAQTLLPKIAADEMKCEQMAFLGGVLAVVAYFDMELGQVQHLFIGIYRNRAQVHELGQHYYIQWLRLWHNKHKMMWAYRQGLGLKMRLLQAIPEIRRCRQDVQVEVRSQRDLLRLEQALKVARDEQFKYAENLRLLLDQRNTIEINLSNYQHRLADIRRLSGDGLGFFEQMIEDAEQHLVQVQKNHDNLSPEMDLLDKLVAHIGVNIGLRKEQRDRRFIQRVEVFGVVFAVAAIIMGSSGDFPIKSIEQAQANPIGQFLAVYLSVPAAWLDSGISIVLSLGISTLPILLWWVLGLFFRK